MHDVPISYSIGTAHTPSFSHKKKMKMQFDKDLESEFKDLFLKAREILLSYVLTGKGKAIRVLPQKGKLDEDVIKYFINQALELNSNK